MKKTILSVLTLALAFAAAQAAKLPMAHVYTNPTGKEIPIMGWYSIPASEATHERYQEMRDAGFNLSFSHFSTSDDVQKGLDASKGTGVKLMITCNELAKEPEKTVRRFMKHGQTAGWFFRDEPSAAAFKSLAKWVQQVRKVDDSHVLYLNLNPNYAPVEALESESYQAYVQGFVDQVPLGLVSYDFYPVVEDGGKIFLRDRYYENMEDVARIAKASGWPFWAFALSTAHKPYPVPTRDMMRLEIFSSLAYGAQGLQYFTYWCPTPGTWDFNNAPIEIDGKRTEVYDLVSEINHEVLNLSWVFLGAKTIDVAHTGEKIPVGTHQLKSLPGHIKSVNASGEGVIVSHLVNGANHFLMIVNRDLHNRQKVTVEKNLPVSRVMPNGKTVNASLYKDALWVNPGDYLLYQWK